MKMQIVEDILYGNTLYPVRLITYQTKLRSGPPVCPHDQCLTRHDIIGVFER